MVLFYVYKHRHQALTGLREFALMTFFLLVTGIIFDLSLIDRFQTHLVFIFALGTSVYFLAHAFYARCALSLFGYYDSRSVNLSRLLLIVPTLMIAASCLNPDIFFVGGPEVNGRNVFFATRFFWLAFLYLAAMYIFILVAALKTPQSFALGNKKQLVLFTLIPALFQSACMVAESCFPARLVSIASCAGFLLPLFITYAYWWYFSSSRRSVTENTREMYVVFDVFGFCADSNRACQRFFREFYGRQKTITLRRLSELIGISIEDLLTMQTAHFQLVKTGKHRYFQIQRFVVQITQLNQLNGTGFLIRDITMHKKEEEKLINLVDKDPLTNVFSRQHFYSVFENLKTDPGNNGRTMSILMLDIDLFKRINDTYGHISGDAVLKIVALRTNACLTSRDYLCRFGGEEFLVLLEDTTLEDAKQTASKILNAISGGAILLPSGESVNITVSIGGSCFTAEPGIKLNDLLREADEKLYFAKSNNRNQAVF
jgi:diguanylate cyclase (GGDEF)-like protein